MNQTTSLTKEQIEAEFLKFERNVTRIGGSSSWGWMGIDISWQSLAKSKGGNIKRGTRWGKIHYTIFCENNREITREEAIREILKPFTLRQAARDLLHIYTCATCGVTVVGEDAVKGITRYKFNPSQNGEYSLESEQLVEAWGSIFYKGQSIWICSACLDRISRGKYYIGGRDGRHQP